MRCTLLAVAIAALQVNVGRHPDQAGQATPPQRMSGRIESIDVRDSSIMITGGEGLTARRYRVSLGNDTRILIAEPRSILQLRVGENAEISFRGATSEGVSAASVLVTRASVAISPPVEIPDKAIEEFEAGLKLQAKATARQAAERLGKAVDLSPHFDRAWYHLGLCHHNYLKDERAAEHAFRKALEVTPEYHAARMGLALSLIGQGRKKEAMALLESLTSAHEGIACYNLACASALLGDADKAFRYLRAAMDAGYDVAGNAIDDPDLAGLKNDPRFKTLTGR